MSCWIVIQGTFVLIFSFLTPTYSKKSLWTDMFGFEFRHFWTPKEIIQWIFKKVFSFLWNSHTWHICTNFQLSNPYIFQKIALNRHFWLRISAFLDPWRDKTVNFQKVFSVLLNTHTRHICTNIQLSNPYIFQKITLNRHVLLRISAFLDP